MNKKKYIFISFVLSSLCFSNFCSDVDPVLVIKGVQSIREQTPQSHIMIKYEYQDPFIYNTYYLDVIFERDNRYFSYTNSGILEKWSFNGSEVLNVIYDKHPSVGIRNLGDSFAAFIFDPRILGISAGMFKTDTVRTTLPYWKDGAVTELIGNDKINGRDVYHIKIRCSTNYIMEYWVDCFNYRVYKHIETVPNSYYRIVISEYDNSYKWLPIKVIITQYSKDDVIQWKNIINIISYETNININKKIWTLTGLNAPKGADVVDHRIKQGLGYWDGKKIVPLHSKQAYESKVPKAILIAAMAIVFLAPLLVMLVRKLRKA
ncbi:MAG: hypothetical protein ACP5TE_04460 [Verrucomicrobiia bacterium]